jgi:hypothetical protein
MAKGISMKGKTNTKNPCPTKVKNKYHKKSPANITFKGSRQRYDWTSIAHDYIFGYTDENTGEIIYPTPDDLANKYGAQNSTVARHLRDEQWDTQRDTYMAKLQRMNSEKVLELVSQDSVNFSVKLFNLSNKLLSRADLILDKPDVNTQDIQGLASACSSLQKTVASIFGEVSPTESVKINVTIGDET